MRNKEVNKKVLGAGTLSYWVHLIMTRSAFSAVKVSSKWGVVNLVKLYSGVYQISKLEGEDYHGRQQCVK